MLEIDAAQEGAAHARAERPYPSLRSALDEIAAAFDRVHRALARIPECFIPAVCPLPSARYNSRPAPGPWGPRQKRVR
jgi:hypothetical protein